jgi:hypothetical protein
VLQSLPAWLFEDRSSNSFEAVYGLVHLAKLCFQVFDGLFMVQDDLQMFEVLSHGIFYPGKCYQHRLKITLKKMGSRQTRGNYRDHFAFVWIILCLCNSTNPISRSSTTSLKLAAPS